MGFLAYLFLVGKIEVMNIPSLREPQNPHNATQSH